MTLIKICGVTLLDDAAIIADAGADFIGLNFWDGSKRRIDRARAPMIAAVARAARPEVAIVGLFVNADDDEIAEIHAEVGLDVIQLHGDEPASACRALAAALGRPIWKAIAVGRAADVARLADWPVDAILLDTPTPGRGGSGQTFDWTIARAAVTQHRDRRCVLAGGLGPANVGAAITTVRPWAIDVASGVERAPGVKDRAKVTALIQAVRNADEPGAPT
jgi:phosphoribosylanthranilate isomerase